MVLYKIESDTIIFTHHCEMQQIDKQIGVENRNTVHNRGQLWPTGTQETVGMSRILIQTH